MEEEASINEPLITALRTFQLANSDEERFVGLLMITKTKSPQSVDDITAIEKAVGYTFLRRLFHTTTDSTIGLLYPRLALSILSLYASSDKIVHSEPFRTIIQDAVEGLNMLLKTSLETERSQLQENKEQVLDIANNDQQLRQQCEISIVEGLQILIASLDAGLNLDIPNDFFENIVIWLKEETIEMHNLLSAVIAFCCRAVMADHHHFTKAVTVLAYIYASRGDLSKLEACRAMFVVLTSTSVDDTSTLSSSLNANEETPFSWFEDIVIASQEMLQHKLGIAERRIILQTLSAALHHSSFASLPETTLSKCLALIARRAAIEVRMTLEQDQIEKCMEDVELTACCFVIVENAITCLVSCGDQMETNISKNVFAGCKMTVEAIQFFLTNASDLNWNVGLYEASLLISGCARVLGVWYAENDNDIDQLIPSAEFLLNLINDKINEPNTLSNESSITLATIISVSETHNPHVWAMDTFAYLLPALCTATAHAACRHSLLTDTNCIQLACHIISTRNQNFEHQNSRLTKSSSMNLACNLLLNVLVEDPEWSNQSAAFGQLVRSCILDLQVKRDADGCQAAVENDLGRAIEKTIHQLVAQNHTIHEVESSSSDPLVAHAEIILMLVMVASELAQLALSKNKLVDEKHPWVQFVISVGRLILASNKCAIPFASQETQITPERADGSAPDAALDTWTQLKAVSLTHLSQCIQASPNLIPLVRSILAPPTREEGCRELQSLLMV